MVLSTIDYLIFLCPSLVHLIWLGFIPCILHSDCMKYKSKTLAGCILAHIHEQALCEQCFTGVMNLALPDERT